MPLSSSTLILLKVFSCFILFVSFFPSQQKETKYYCVALCKHLGCLRYLWSCVCLARSEIAGKKHSFQCRATVEVHHSMFGLIERSGGNQQIRDYPSGSGERQCWDVTEALPLLFCLLQPVLVSLASSLRLQKTQSLFYLTCPIDKPPLYLPPQSSSYSQLRMVQFFFPVILFLFHSVYSACPISYKF